MIEPPTLTTRRLLLRSFQPSDAPRIAELAGESAIAATTLHIPHPYPPGEAERFIEGQRQLYHHGAGAAFGVVLRAEERLIGCVGLGCEEDHHHAELGYWIGTAYHGHGYATEAARQVVAYGFSHLRLHRIMARHFASNPASGRVLEKIGMQREGCLRQHFFKEGRGFEDAVLYGLLQTEWIALARKHTEG